MVLKGRKVCPECLGKKIVQGACVCNSEWRGTEIDGVWNDCQCNREETCPICLGTGYVNEDEE